MNVSMSDSRRILVTAALPYANGPIHLGHMVEYLQADFWTRFQKMRGHECLYFCADDTHGTPIMVRARKENRSPEDIIAQSYEEHLKDFTDFGIEFTHFSSTHSETNKKLCQKIYLAMREGGHCHICPVEQTYCEHDKMFLPDRFVKGTCPKCKSTNQYGDSCDNCGATYSPTDMSNSQCTLCGNPPIRKESDHVFFKLDHFKDFLKEWVPAHNSKEVSKKLNEWLGEELRDWDISRDEPYFGFEIPELPGKYFYVWVDAPMGYVSTSQEWFAKQSRDYLEYWGEESTGEVYHFIGKDIIYFHSLFWPAMLKSANYRRPTQVCVHGFLTVNGEKMSKSKGTFIMARTYLNHMDPSYLRYYYGCKLSNDLNDIDLNLEDFVQRVNSDLIGKFINIGSRSAKILSTQFNNTLASTLDDKAQTILDLARSKEKLIAELYEEREFAKALVEIRTIADEANKYFDEIAPWKLVKAEDGDKNLAHISLTTALTLFRILAIYLQPILPEISHKVSQLFNESGFRWTNVFDDKLNSQIQPFTHLLKRLDNKKVEQMVECSQP